MRWLAGAGPLLGIVLAAALFPMTRGFDALAREGQLGAGFWPRLVLVGLAIGCVAKLVEDWRIAQRAPRPARPPISWALLVASIAAILLYGAAAEWLGFPLATALFIAAFMALCGARSPLAIAVHSVAGTAILIYTFVRLVYLPLPKGEGPFETLTVALYRALGIF